MFLPVPVRREMELGNSQRGKRVRAMLADTGVTQDALNVFIAKHWKEFTLNSLQQAIADATPKKTPANAPAGAVSQGVIVELEKPLPPVEETPPPSLRGKPMTVEQLGYLILQHRDEGRSVIAPSAFDVMLRVIMAQVKAQSKFIALRVPFPVFALQVLCEKNRVCANTEIYLSSVFWLDGTRLRVAREIAGLSQSQLAERVATELGPNVLTKMNQEMVSGWERGDFAYIPDTYAKALSKTLGVDAADLYHPEAVATLAPYAQGNNPHDSLTPEDLDDLEEQPEPSYTEQNHQFTVLATKDGHEVRRNTESGHLRDQLVEMGQMLSQAGAQLSAMAGRLAHSETCIAEAQRLRELNDRLDRENQDLARRLQEEQEASQRERDHSAHLQAQIEKHKSAMGALRAMLSE